MAQLQATKDMAVDLTERAGKKSRFRWGTLWQDNQRSYTLQIWPLWKDDEEKATPEGKTREVLFVVYHNQCKGHTKHEELCGFTITKCAKGLRRCYSLTENTPHQ
ncbi:hypothetical protein CHARACLAT_015763 [Characodon lateralis]|uniref:Uncharacterized protein n=1 Tax=Characodon lateralis TaxID=208331 RepID=A0ABU7EMN7_9TELE|nr:hypothetical protein [Characodon lateralis]